MNTAVPQRVNTPLYNLHLSRKLLKYNYLYAQKKWLNYKFSSPMSDVAEPIKLLVLDKATG